MDKGVIFKKRWCRVGGDRKHWISFLTTEFARPSRFAMSVVLVVFLILANSSIQRLFILNSVDKTIYPLETTNL